MGKEIDRLAEHMQIYQYFIYNSGTRQHIMQDTGYDDTDQSQDNGDPNVVEGSLHTLGCVVAIYREKLQQSGAADHDIGIL